MYQFWLEGLTMIFALTVFKANFPMGLMVVM